MTHPIHPVYGPCDLLGPDYECCSECVRITNLLAARAEAAEKAQDLLAARHLEDERRLTVAREALKVADEHFKGAGYPCDDIGCPQTICDRASRVRAALKDIDQ